MDPRPDSALATMTHSIVVVSWQSRPYLEALIASMDRWLAVETELVLVDNASDDGPEEALAAWKGRARFHRNEENLGFGAAANSGVELASGQVTTILNSDVELLDPGLEELARHALRSNAICGPRLLDADGRPQPSASGPEVGAWPWVRAIVPGAVQPAPIRARTEPWRSERTQPVTWLTGACICAPRSLLLELGPFDPAIHMYGEDMDLGLRAAAAGIQSLFCPDVARLVHHGRGSSALRYPEGPVELITANRQRVLHSAYGERREAIARRAFRLNLWLRVRAKALLQLDSDRERAYRRAIANHNGARVAGKPALAHAELPITHNGNGNGRPAAVSNGNGNRAVAAAGRNGTTVNGHRKRPLRSLAVMHLADVSGPARSLEHGLQWLAQHGELEVLLPGQGHLVTEFGRFARVRSREYSVLTVPRGPAAMVSAIGGFRRDVRLLQRAIRSSRADLVIVASALLPAALLASRLEGVPSILYAGELLDPPRVPTRQRLIAGDAVIRFAARSASAVIANSDPVARQYTSRGADRVSTLFPPIDERYASGDGARFRAAHNLPAEAPLIVAVGAITHGRGQDVLLRALPAIRRAVHDVHCAIVGAPHPRKLDRAFDREVRELAEQLAPGAVSFTGPAGRVEDAYAAADLVINPARYESFGRVPFEALSAGCPVVASAVGGARELLARSPSATLVPDEDPRAITDAAVALLGDTLSTESGSAACEVVDRQLRPSQWCAGFESVLAAALNLTANGTSTVERERIADPASGAHV